MRDIKSVSEVRSRIYEDPEKAPAEAWADLEKMYADRLDGKIAIGDVSVTKWLTVIAFFVLGVIIAFLPAGSSGAPIGVVAKVGGGMFSMAGALLCLAPDSWADRARPIVTGIGEPLFGLTTFFAGIWIQGLMDGKEAGGVRVVVQTLVCWLISYFLLRLVVVLKGKSDDERWREYVIVLAAEPEGEAAGARQCADGGVTDSCS